MIYQILCKVLNNLHTQSCTIILNCKFVVEDSQMIKLIDIFGLTQG